MYNILCSYGIENYSYDVSIYTQQWERLGEWKQKKTETNIENQ